MYCLPYQVHEPKLHAPLSHSARTASSSLAARPGQSVGSSAGRSSRRIRSSLLPVYTQPYINTESLMFILKQACSTNLDVIVSLDKSFPDLTGQSTISGVFLQSLFVDLYGFLWLEDNSSYTQSLHSLDRSKGSNTMCNTIFVNCLLLF